MATCARCGDFFPRPERESWKTLCLPCWKVSQRIDLIRSLETQLATAKSQLAWWRDRCNDLETELEDSADDLSHELREQMPRLLLCCHPDRHANSVASTKATQWLLSVKRRLQ
jgi:hypothetical protein